MEDLVDQKMIQKKSSKKRFLSIFALRFQFSCFSLAEFDFLIRRFLVWMSPTPTPRTKISIDVPVDRLEVSRSRLELGTRKGPSGTTQLDSVLS